MFTRSEADDDAVQGPNIRYPTDGIEAAMTRAKKAAGERNVLVHGATTAQLALHAGVLDELEIHQIPVLLGADRSLFGPLGAPRQLDLVRAIDAPGATHLRYHVIG
ncbi:dihydrofolate reductase family protein [Streptomyces sp. NPDC048650]|uniref:dihydrofolate reductase family protein n=1 Tax=unclassified Streptomyces TaxID=2593676 RepID=UPI003716306B